MEAETGWFSASTLDSNLTKVSAGVLCDKSLQKAEDEELPGEDDLEFWLGCLLELLGSGVWFKNKVDSILCFVASSFTFDKSFGAWKSNQTDYFIKIMMSTKLDKTKIFWDNFLPCVLCESCTKTEIIR